MIVGTRIYDLLKERGISQAELARRIGMSQQAVWKLIYGHSLSSSKIHLIARELGTSVEYLEGGDDEWAAAHRDNTGAVDRADFVGEGGPAYRGEPVTRLEVDQADFALIPQIEIGFSMGGGLHLDEHVEAHVVPLPRQWLKPAMKGNFNQLRIVTGEGDSMEPTLRDGDICVIDTAQNALNGQDRIWCLGYGDLGMIKRVRAMPDGGLQIISDNSNVRPFTAYDGEVQIFGRVIWIGRRI